MSPAASRMHLFACNPIARAHRADVFAPTFANSDAAQRGAREAASIVTGKLEVSLQRRRAIIDAKAQVFVCPVRIDDLSGIHLPIGVPDRLELVEGAHQFRAKHFGEQLAARLTVAMLTGQRSAIANDEIGRSMDKGPIFFDTCFGHEVEIDACVDTPLAEVAVERAGIPELREKLSEIAQITPQFFGRHGGIFPAFPSILRAGKDRKSTRLNSSHPSIS